MGKYNLTAKKDRPAAYIDLVRAELVDDLYEKILKEIVVNKRYRDPDFSAKKLAEILDTNTRYISAVINIRFNQNYSQLVNDYRIKDARHLLTDKRYLDKSMEEISTMVGFANRQSFYASFYRVMGITPRHYKMQYLASQKADK